MPITFVIVYGGGMDQLSQLLRSHAGRDAYVLPCAMVAPWAVRIADRATVGLVLVTGGSCVLTAADGTTATLGPGDVAAVRGPDPYELADAAGRPVGVVVEPGQLCRTVDAGMGIDLQPDRCWGNRTPGAEAGCTFVAAAYELPDQVTGRLLEALPALVVLPAPQVDPSLVAGLAGELARGLPGADVVVDRYVDLVLVAAVRAWFARPEAEPPRWWSAQSDPLVAQVLALVHDRPAEPWTLVGLADQVGYSRAGLSRRFRAALGQSPISYLTQFRLDLAADELLRGSAAVEAVARSVGYANPFAFSTAFKRQHGCSPRHYRAAAA